MWKELITSVIVGAGTAENNQQTLMTLSAICFFLLQLAALACIENAQTMSWSDYFLIPD